MCRRPARGRGIPTGPHPVGLDRSRRAGSVATLSAVAFHPGAVQGAATGRSGEIDYRMARRALVSEFRKGRLARHEVCDAHPELRRNARECGLPTSEPCPICETASLVLVTYVFGPRLPPGGRCLTSARELRALARRTGAFTCYVVEVCTDCHWNHLARVFPLER